ncbi:hypothetical protein J6590_083036 [Homalodisca vitripennis]|nr:hypothetical protein J6590_083036 [Homalodisca vitripennis]
MTVGNPKHSRPHPVTMRRLSMPQQAGTYIRMRHEVENYYELQATEQWFLPASQAGVNFINRLPNSIKNSITPKAFKRRLKHLLVSQAFYNAGEFLAFNWETAQLHD